eukprot:gnl/MRDRNA2_/MRDRNA2_176275_c0_seq1.p1 gnl/MRDRNA2_/MRDRNA2_176275_c0~~gnl/MRDRNA2_/MRDRNA2_176275_c0_seq1.p1  ORF type:complete len:259 (-),score=37.66 gnl/MRDRNA2_/MRDRNA2_176275_c0_seq1:4-780(-)
MVIPISSRSPIFLGPPSDEALKVIPRLRASLFLVAVATVAELIAMYSNEALASFCTVLIGRALLRDYRAWSFCLSSFLLICWTNAVLIAGLLFLIMSGKAHVPGVGAFFSTSCPIHDGKLDPCSWQTALGNTAIALSFIGHFLCGHFGLQLGRQIQRQTSEQLMSFDSLEAMETGSLFQSLSYPRTELGLLGNIPSPDSSNVMGITPYSGTGHQIIPDGSCAPQPVIQSPDSTNQNDANASEESRPPVAFTGQALRLD